MIPSHTVFFGTISTKPFILWIYLTLRSHALVVLLTSFIGLRSVFFLAQRHYPLSVYTASFVTLNLFLMFEYGSPPQSTLLKSHISMNLVFLLAYRTHWLSVLLSAFIDLSPVLLFSYQIHDSSTSCSSFLHLSGRSVLFIFVLPFSISALYPFWRRRCTFWLTWKGSRNREKIECLGNDIGLCRCCTWGYCFATGISATCWKK